MVRRKPSWSGEFHQKGSGSSELQSDSNSGDCSSSCCKSGKLVYKRGVLISSSSNNISPNEPVIKDVKVQRSSSLFNITNKWAEPTNNNNNDFVPVSFWRRNTFPENTFSEDDKKFYEELKRNKNSNTNTEFQSQQKTSTTTSISQSQSQQIQQVQQFGESEEKSSCCEFSTVSTPAVEEDDDEYSMALVNKSHNNSQKQLNNSRRDVKDFVPSFVLVDACKETNEHKIRELVKRLCNISSLELEPIVNFQDPTGRTALSYSCGSGNVSIVEELSKLRRLNPNLPDNDGNTPLHYASQAGHSEVMDLMLSRFEGVVDPNCRNSTGLTPLMKAALQGRTRCAKSLIIAGASPHLQDYSRGLTAIEWARLCGRHICAEVIIRSVKDNYKHHPGSPTMPTSLSNGHHRPMPASQSSMELKRLNSDDSPYYNLYQARSAISGATWLKNKIKKALGATGTNPSSMPRIGTSSRSRPDALMSNSLSKATICASSLLLPSIKPLLDQQQKSRTKKKLTIPTLQVTTHGSKR